MNIDDERIIHIVAGIIVETIAIVGISASLAAVSLIYRSPSYHNAFGFICTSHLLADVGLLSSFLFWTGPSLIGGLSESITHSYVGKRIGQYSMLFWYASIYGQLQLAINRLIAISSPMMYRTMFSLRRTVQVLIFFWILSALHVIVYFLDGCDFIFDTSTMVWTYSTSICGEIISFYLDFVHGTTLCTVVIVINTFTFMAIYRATKKLSTSTNGKQDLIMLRRNVRLYVQTCVQAGCFALMIISFHVLSRFAKNEWQQFLLTTFVWELVHAFDGIIIFMFYENFRKVICKPSLLWQKNQKGYAASVTTFSITRL